MLGFSVALTVANLANIFFASVPEATEAAIAANDIQTGAVRAGPHAWLARPVMRRLAAIRSTSRCHGSSHAVKARIVCDASLDIHEVVTRKLAIDGWVDCV